MAFRLSVPQPIMEELVAQAVMEAPLECCGLLAGVCEKGNVGEEAVARVLRRYPLINGAASPSEFLSDDRSMLDADRDMRARGLDILAVYHSHPTSAAIPSRTDLARHWYKDVVCIIVSLADPPDVKAWWLKETEYEEVEWDWSTIDTSLLFRH